MKRNRFRGNRLTESQRLKRAISIIERMILESPEDDINAMTDKFIEWFQEQIEVAITDEEGWVGVQSSYSAPVIWHNLDHKGDWGVIVDFLLDKYSSEGGKLSNYEDAANKAEEYLNQRLA